MIIIPKPLAISDTPIIAPVIKGGVWVMDSRCFWRCSQRFGVNRSMLGTIKGFGFRVVLRKHMMRKKP